MVGHLVIVVGTMGCGKSVSEDLTFARHGAESVIFLNPDDDPAINLETWRTRVLNVFKLRQSQSENFRHELKLANTPLMNATRQWATLELPNLRGKNVTVFVHLIDQALMLQSMAPYALIVIFTGSLTQVNQTLSRRKVSPQQLSTEVETSVAATDWKTNLRTTGLNPDTTYVLWGDIRERPQYFPNYDQNPVMWNAQMLSAVWESLLTGNRYFAEAFKGLKYGLQSGVYPPQQFGAIRKLSLSYAEKPECESYGGTGTWLGIMGYPSYNVPGAKLKVMPDVNSRIALNCWSLEIPVLSIEDIVVIALRAPYLRQKRGREVESAPTSPSAVRTKTVPPTTKTNKRRRKTKASKATKVSEDASKAGGRMLSVQGSADSNL